MAQCIDSSEAGRRSQPMAVNFSFQRYARHRVSICDCVTVLGCELIARTRASGLAAVAPVGLACERQTFLFRETSLSGDEQGETSAIRRLRSDGQFSLCLSPGCAGYHAAKSMRGIKHIKHKLFHSFTIRTKYEACKVLVLQAGKVR